MKQIFNTVEELLEELPPGVDEMVVRLVWFALEPETLRLSKVYAALKDINSNTEDSLNLHLEELRNATKEIVDLKESLDARVLQNLRDEVYKLKGLLHKFHNLD